MTLKEKFHTNKENHLVVKFSEPCDQQRVFNFYQQNIHKHVDKRKADVWNERTKDGRVIIVEDNEEHLGFLSVAYDFEHDGKVKWIEFGSTMNQQDPNKKPYELIKGITLYPSIIASQTIHEFLNNTPEDKFIANIYEDNQAVIYMLNERTGWKFFEPEDDILKACKATKGDVNQHGAKRLWLESTTDTLPHQARLLLDFIDSGTTTGLFNKKSQKHIKLDVSKFSLANEFRTAVEALAFGPLAEKLENSPHIGMAKARELLEQHLKQQVNSPSPRP